MRKTATPEEYWRERIEIDPETGCWLWTGQLKPDGYGFWRRIDENRGRSAHAVIWEAQRGPVPEGMELDHLCKRRRCTNPDHLEPVTHIENCRRGAGSATHCKRGHSLADAYIREGGKRECRPCGLARRKAAAARMRQGIAQPRSTTHCQRGHPFDEENTIVEKSGARKCRTCYRAAQRRRYHEGRQQKE